MEQEVGLFGVAFDPMPTKEAVVIKKMYILAQALGKIALPNYLDPSDALLAKLGIER